MIALGLVFALLVAAPRQSGSTESQTATQQRAHDEYERHKQAAIRINNLAGEIHSEADASAFVSEIAGLFARELPPAWASSGIRQRVAHAEYEAIREPAKLISEQRVVDVWNQYVREIGAPDEAIVSAAEIHNMRDASFTVAQLMWARGNQTTWTMPNVYALGSDGKVADGCRALDALRVIHDLDDLFQNLRGARDRLRRGIVPSEEIKKRVAGPTPQPHTRLGLKRTQTQIRFALLNSATCKSMAQRHTTSCLYAYLTNCSPPSEEAFPQQAKRRDWKRWGSKSRPPNRDGYAGALCM
jgi:hypothetical protein